MPIRRRAATAGISVPVTACAIQTAIFLLKIRRDDNAITIRVMVILAMAAGNTTAVADIAVAGIRCPAVTELMSISGMGVAIPPAQCHADFKTAAVIDRASLPRLKRGTVACPLQAVISIGAGAWASLCRSPAVAHTVDLLHEQHDGKAGHQ